MALAVGQLIKRYCLVTILPAVVVSSIYSDWSRTQWYKEQKKQKNVPDYS